MDPFKLKGFLFFHTSARSAEPLTDIDFWISLSFMAYSLPYPGIPNIDKMTTLILYLAGIVGFALFFKCIDWFEKI